MADGGVDKRGPSKTQAAIFIGGLIGVLVGVTAFTFHYAEGFSYASNDPKVCVNCHIMNQQFTSWQKSSHHAAATCVDCHLPHSLVPKMMAKASNGYHHSKGFTFQDFHEPIMIKANNSQILQESCLRCHDDMVHNLVMGAKSEKDAVRCVHCHQSVGHGEPTGLGGKDKDIHD